MCSFLQNENAKFNRQVFIRTPCDAALRCSVETARRNKARCQKPFISYTMQMSTDRVLSCFQTLDILELSMIEILAMNISIILMYDWEKYSKHLFY